MSGFTCKFTKNPPEYLQCFCPICLLILCEPYQATCCGKSFCKDCIQQIQARKKPCPTCNEENFICFQNKGLQQPLYGFRVFCSNKEDGCGWQGELGQLEQHLNDYPNDEKQLVGCLYTSINCVFCYELYLRSEIENHQTSECVQKTATCTMCHEYISYYEEVIMEHAPKCKCRPVECPNSCGVGTLEYQHLKDHVSKYCPLTQVKCEFNEIGCNISLRRKDLSSHLINDMVTHMSLLARENRNLKHDLGKVKSEALDLKEQVGAVKAECSELKAVQNKTLALCQQLEVQSKKEREKSLKLANTIEMQAKCLAMERNFTVPFSRIVPLELPCQVMPLGTSYKSEPFYSHAGGYKLQLEALLQGFLTSRLKVRYIFLDSEFVVKYPKVLEITTNLVREDSGTKCASMKHKVVSQSCSDYVTILIDVKKYLKPDDTILMRISDIKSVQE